MYSFLKETKRFLSVAAIVGLLLGGLFALCYAPLMKMGTEGTAMNQSFNLHSSANKCCTQASSLHHSNTIAAVPAVSVVEVLLLLAGLGYVSFVSDSLTNLLNSVQFFIDASRNLIFKLFHYFINALSKGILQPKIFNA